VILFASAVFVCVAALRRWGGQAGSGWLAGALLAAVVLMMQDLRAVFRAARNG
jgi:hypothetical protein